MKHRAALLPGILLLSCPILQAAADDDLNALQQLARERGVVTAPPEPSLPLYFGELFRRFFQWLGGFFSIKAPDFSHVSTLVDFFASLLAWSLLLLCILLIFRLLVPRFRKRAGVMRAEAVNPLERIPEEVRPDAPAWKNAFDNALRSGDLIAALESLWYWMASALSGGSPDSSWTSTELLRAHSREELLPYFRRLDAWRYGSEAPPLDAVRQLAEAMEADL